LLSQLLVGGIILSLGTMAVFVGATSMLQSSGVGTYTRSFDLTKMPCIFIEL
jgi:hypothetical protein